MLKGLDHDTLNENVKKVQYAIIFTNVGNPHALGQKPLSFPRQAILMWGLSFPADAIARAKHYLSLTSGGLGAYSDSRGLPGIRKEVAGFIEKRDGYPELIFLTDGASKGVMQMLNTIIRSEKDGILVPVPQYPLYSAAISLYGGSLVPYYLEESANWGLDVNNLRQSVRAMVIINPGNPTGQCLSIDNLQELLYDFVPREKLVSSRMKFISRTYTRINVLLDMGCGISKDVQLVSFHTVSKVIGENIYKVASISLSPNVPGQIFVIGSDGQPSKAWNISYLKFVQESKTILESLRKRAHIMTNGLTVAETAMYSFPQNKSSSKNNQAAKMAGKFPDVYTI
ncbi:hypothetical protein MKW92_044754, partial [Papaver armeniacum]